MIDVNEVDKFFENIATQIAIGAQGIVPQASGELKRSIYCDVERNGYVWRVWFHAADWWDYLSEGRKPGKYPPPDAIRKWIEVKPVIPYPDRSGKIPTLQQLTYLISRKIFEVGIKPRNFNWWLDQKVKKYKELIVKEFENQIRINEI